MSLHADALAVLTSWRAPSPAQESLRLRYADHLAAHDDGLWRSCLPDHVTVGAVVLSADATSVLLNLHRKARRWFHFGGHCEPGDVTLAEVALREVLEESGLESVRMTDEPVQLSEHAVPFCSPGSDVHHLDVRYAAVADGSAHAVSDESLDVRWWPLDGLPELEDEMLELIDLARVRVG